MAMVLTSPDLDEPEGQLQTRCGCCGRLSASIGKGRGVTIRRNIIALGLIVAVPAGAFAVPHADGHQAAIAGLGDPPPARGVEDAITSLERQLRERTDPGQLDDAERLLVRTHDWHPRLQKMVQAVKHRRLTRNTLAARQLLHFNARRYLEGDGVPFDPVRAAELTIKAYSIPGAKRGIILHGSDTYPPEYIDALRRLGAEAGVTVRVMSANNRGDGKKLLLITPPPEK